MLATEGRSDDVNKDQDQKPPGRSISLSRSRIAIVMNPGTDKTDQGSVFDVRIPGSYWSGAKVFSRDARRSHQG